MSVAPLPNTGGARLTPASAQRRKVPSNRRMAGRRRVVTWSKRALPMMAVLLMALLVVWPQLLRRLDMTRVSQQLGREVRQGHLVNLRYHGLDERNRPYTVTAAEAQQVDASRIDLSKPKADILSENGSWTFVVADKGVYTEHAGQLDLSGDVVVYRDNGVTMQSQSAAIDLKAGASAGNQPTHTEGPFGTLDSQGFALVDKGQVIQFDGKSRLLLNGSHVQ